MFERAAPPIAKKKNRKPQAPPPPPESDCSETSTPDVAKKKKWNRKWLARHGPKRAAPKSPPPPPPPLPLPDVIPRWTPMGHTCSMCPKKTSDPAFFHTCLKEHAFVCASFHPTLHRRGSSDKCVACTRESVALLRRGDEIDAARAELSALEHPDALAKVKKCSVKKARARVLELEVKDVNARAETDLQTEIRRKGYMEWSSGTPAVV